MNFKLKTTNQWESLKSSNSMLSTFMVECSFAELFVLECVLE